MLGCLGLVYVLTLVFFIVAIFVDMFTMFLLDSALTAFCSFLAACGFLFYGGSLLLALRPLLRRLSGADGYEESTDDSAPNPQPLLSPEAIAFSKATEKEVRIKLYKICVVTIICFISFVFRSLIDIEDFRLLFISIYEMIQNQSSTVHTGTRTFPTYWWVYVFSYYFGTELLCTFVVLLTLGPWTSPAKPRGPDPPPEHLPSA